MRSRDSVLFLPATYLCRNRLVCRWWLLRVDLLRSRLDAPLWYMLSFLGKGSIPASHRISSHTIQEWSSPVLSSFGSDGLASIQAYRRLYLSCLTNIYQGWLKPQCIYLLHGSRLQHQHRCILRYPRMGSYRLYPL